MLSTLLGSRSLDELKFSNSEQHELVQVLRTGSNFGGRTVIVRIVGNVEGFVQAYGDDKIQEFLKENYHLNHMPVIHAEGILIQQPLNKEIFDILKGEDHPEIGFRGITSNLEEIRQLLPTASSGVISQNKRKNTFRKLKQFLKGLRPRIFRQNRVCKDAEGAFCYFLDQGNLQNPSSEYLKKSTYQRP